MNLEPLKTLKNIEFRHLLFGRFFLILAFRMLATLLGWWVYQLTKDPLSIGFIGLSEVIPAVSTALYAGYVIDMNEKKRMLLICNYVYVLLISALVALAFLENSYHLTGHQISYFIYAVIFLTGICRAFIGPLVPSMIPKMVKKENLANAVTLNQATFLTSSVFGHALGGFLIALITIKWTLVIIVSLMTLASIFFWQLKPQHSEYDKKEVKVLESMREGLAYIYKTKEILGALCLDMFAVLFGGAVAMIPVYASDILKVGAEGFGLLNAASDIGSMCIIILLSFIPLRRNQGKILLVAVAGFGMCIIGFGLSKLYWLSFFFLMLSGMLDGISVVIRGTIVQLKTPDKIRGRVLSVNSIFIMSSNEMGQFESGLAAKLLGVVRSVIFGGSMTLAIALMVGLTNKKLRKMEY
ncbi:MFS transporter [Riemerella anatipestifer]|uniref:MFS transporter n=1 Tax=Riemerella anatipestifer TaxID=34085 RepID=A0AAP6HI98_RIEAN|nr:MFS transporter [Riemerella anatipestifer]MCO7355215.1 MFS transporter [Riemerella anatipestifer]MCU7540460.1 MFS transporter [Riemerella anatipestifer]MCU7570499.1 MFS transporter [Riemerella anatipestifer]MCU7598424.1 MFS transporter [Riemerella anatipestifer]MCW0495046.1 MFS transporter [Riemerella anatipestifer]